MNVRGALAVTVLALCLAPVDRAGARAPTLGLDVAAGSGYVVDGWGGVHPFGGAPAVAVSAYWPGWDIARGVAVNGDGHSGWTLDGWGGLHPFGGAPAVAVSAYWPGWDIARSLVTRPDGHSGWTLDGWGGLHPFGGAPAVAVSAYWPGWDIARGVTLNACDATGSSGWVLDGWGALHPFGGAPALASRYWGGVDIARGIATWCATGMPAGYTLDGWGGVHPFGAAPAIDGPHWSGWDIARGVVLDATHDGGWVVDGWGGVHPFGAAPAVDVTGYWPGWDIARGAGSSGGGGGAMPHRVGRTVLPLQGVGAWADMFDWTQALTGGHPTVDAAEIDNMAAVGVRTLFIQATRYTYPGIIEAPLLASLIDRAHADGMAVCAWLLPGFGDLAADEARIGAVAALDVDCVAIDIEPTPVQADPDTRNANLVALSAYARSVLPSALPLAAVVLPAVVTEILSPNLWPNFPWSAIRSQYDGWMPMDYWTTREANHPEWRDAYRYTTENVNRLRADLHDPGALVSAIGGIGDKITAADITAFKAAVDATDCYGLSIYDWASTPPDLRGALS
jgi:hypothetical protein